MADAAMVALASRSDDLSTTYRGVVHASQCNHMGHMSVMWYASSFDDASRQLLSLLGLTPAYFRRHNRFMATLQQETTFNRELAAGDLIEIRSRMLEIRENALRVYHEMLHVEANETVAVSTSTEVHLNGVTRETCPLPRAIQRHSPWDSVHDRQAGELRAPVRALEVGLPGQW